MTTKPDHDQVFIAGMSWSRSDGMRVKTGERVRGDDERYRAHPEYFYADGSTNTIDVLAEASKWEEKHQDADRAAARQREHHPTEADVVTATTSFEIGIVDISSEDAQRLRLASVIVPVGARFWRGSPIPRTWGHLFTDTEPNKFTITKKPLQPAQAVLGQREVAD